MTSITAVGETNSSISVRGLWKVYGPKPERVVGSELADLPRKQLEAQTNRWDDLVRAVNRILRPAAE